jgi:hypothetical protein
MKCPAKSAAERYHSGFELSDALQAFLTASATVDDSRMAFYARQTGASATATDL